MDETFIRFFAVPRGVFSGPENENCDMPQERNLNRSESRSLELRIEAFSVFNHDQFSEAVAATVTSAARPSGKS